MFMITDNLIGVVVEMFSDFDKSRRKDVCVTCEVKFFDEASRCARETGKRGRRKLGERS